uniref:Innexin n=1 Tax=Acrobeloides nanus TaxID=290746 RepID=A0A914C7N1_9BILA
MFDSRREIERNSISLNYYQFVPYIMLIQTFLWYAPQAFWRFTSNSTVFNLDAIIGLRIKKKNKDDKKVSNMEYDLERFVLHVQQHIEYARKAQWLPWLVIYYLVTKWLYVATAFLQLTILCYFIGERDYFWGFKKFIDATSTGQWVQLKAFPYIAYCDAIQFEIAQPRLHTFQCVLPMNMLFDKVYIFLWFMIVFVLLISFLSAIYATLLFTIPWLKHRELCKILQLPMNSPKRRLVPVFLNKHLSMDGFLLLRILKENTGAVSAYEIAQLFWPKIEGF